ncbi:MAG: NYN domain-containing protein [Akkermansia sp.]|nr:NYN domain-containing protein [Akkermansia sp.]
MQHTYSILIDGGYFSKIYSSKRNAYPTAADVMRVTDRIQQTPDFLNKELLRIYYYDAPPLQTKITNPISKAQIDLGNSDLAKRAQRLHATLSQSPDFALRLGELKQNTWAVKPKVWPSDKAPSQNSVILTADDIKPDIKQKGVDLRIGMDIACMAIRKNVQTIVLITGDSDMVPALKLARREGLRVYCVQMDTQHITDELKIHSDRILPIDTAP